MPGYVIHLAIAKRFIEKNKGYEEESFVKGIIAPDILQEERGKEATHFGVQSKFSNPKKYLEISGGLDKGYIAGYTLHLITDVLFYHKYFQQWSPKIYDDYDILNKELIEKYHIDLPEEIKKKIFFKEGELTFLERDKLDICIEEISDINIEEYLKNN